MSTSRITYNDPDCRGSFNLPYHWEMVFDRRRLRAFQRAIDSACPGRRVLETGAGSGILSLMALRAGAVGAVAVESDPRIAEFARTNFAAADYSSVRLLEMDILDLRPEDLRGEVIDVVIAEHLSTWQVTEPQIAVMNHIHRVLGESATISVPSRVWNFAELADAQFTFDGLISLRTHFIEFTGVEQAGILSGKRLFREVKFDRPQAAENSGEVLLEALLPGCVNSLRLTSPVELYPGTIFHGSDSLMPPVIVPIVDDCIVEPGDTVRASISYQMGSGWERFVCTATNLGRGNHMP